MRLAISVALVLVGALVWCAPVGASTIRVNAIPTRMESERPPFGREGNVEWLKWSIRDRYGRTIGNAVFDCRWVQRFTRICYGQLHLPLGDVSLLGTSATRDSGIYAVVGGTGTYRDQGGEMTWFSTSIRRISVLIEF